MQFKCIQHVDLSGLQMDSESALTSSGKHSITDDYDSLKKGQNLKRRRLCQCNSFNKTVNIIKVEFHQRCSSHQPTPSSEMRPSIVQNSNQFAVSISLASCCALNVSRVKFLGKVTSFTVSVLLFHLFVLYLQKKVAWRESSP